MESRVCLAELWRWRWCLHESGCLAMEEGASIERKSLYWVILRDTFGLPDRSARAGCLTRSESTLCKTAIDKSRYKQRERQWANTMSRCCLHVQKAKLNQKVELRNKHPNIKRGIEGKRPSRREHIDIKQQVWQDAEKHSLTQTGRRNPSAAQHQTRPEPSKHRSHTKRQLSCHQPSP
jgi:hypothetical protein